MLKCKTCACPKNQAALAIFTINMVKLEARGQTSSQPRFQPPRQPSNHLEPFMSSSGAKRKRFQSIRFQQVLIHFSMRGKCALRMMQRCLGRSRRDLSARLQEVTSQAGSSIRLSWRTINAPQLAHQPTTPQLQ